MLSVVPDLLVITVATDETDGFKQFLHSAKKYGLKVKVPFTALCFCLFLLFNSKCFCFGTLMVAFVHQSFHYYYYYYYESEWSAVQGQTELRLCHGWVILWMYTSKAFN